jgi:hypothetical protein
VKQKRPAAIIWLLIIYVPTFLTGLYHTAVFSSSQNYHLFKQAGVEYLFFALSIPTLVLTGLTLWFLWKPKPAGFWIAIVGLVLQITTPLIFLLITLNNPDVAQDAYILYREARGRPVDLEVLDKVVSVPDIFIAFGRTVASRLLIAALLLWKSDYFGRRRQAVKYKQGAGEQIEEKVRSKYRETISVLTRIGFDELCFYNETHPFFGLSFGLTGLIGNLMVLFKEVTKIRGFLSISAFYPLLISKEYATYVQVFSLGVKFYTHFTDETTLISQNFRKCHVSDEREKYYKFGESRSIEAAWEFHRATVDRLRSEGKKFKDNICFEDFVQISNREDGYLLRHDWWVEVAA